MDPIIWRMLERGIVLASGLFSFLAGFIIVLRLSMRFDPELGKDKIIVRGATPSLLAMLLGIILIGLVLLSPIKYRESEQWKGVNSGDLEELTHSRRIWCWKRIAMNSASRRGLRAF